ncbi:hypothetical protein B6N60_04131 [Richelia sinica FACHB-800]|uniref:SLH domain-containing protein n=2 Tax=Richelia TaxID=98443 RepID=A0A975TAV4_9NOST|nr:iron uptake porin [Richelia sinica]QXE25416.1 hypothetical protein B6N60_04131 [Richelia sinica FACHB-800]
MRRNLQKIAISLLITSTALISPLSTSAQTLTVSDSSDPIEQVTSVSQLSDVQPTDWSFQALQNLVERYGCIAGYPNGTFRGNRVITRYEFAAGLNACLDSIFQRIAVLDSSEYASKQDLETLQKLQQEFAAELASLRGRLDALEPRIATIEQQQFSTTTKFNGQVWFNLSGASTGGNVKFESTPAIDGSVPAAAPDGGVRLAGRDPAGKPLVQRTNKASTTLSFFSNLTLNTSFNGQDLLVTQLAVGNGISPNNQFASAGFFNTFGVPFTDQTAGTVNGSPDVVLQTLSYTFPVNDAVRVTFGPRVNWYNYFDFNRFTYYLTGASSYDSIDNTLTNVVDTGSGAVVEWNINKNWRFAAAYLGENIPFLPSEYGFNTSSNPEYGLFGGTNSTTAELTYIPTDNLSFRLLYSYGRIQAYAGQVGGSIGEPLPYGYVDAGPGYSVFDPTTGLTSDGGLSYAYAHTFSFNFDWLITPRFGIFGRYAYGATTLKPINQAVNTQAFQVGLGFPDLGKKGALGVISFVMPMDILSGRKYFVAGGGDGGTMYELEASYYYPINDNFAIVPAVYTIFNPNNFDSNPNIYIGNLRAQFSF